MDGGGDRTGGARLCRAQGRQARRGGAAAARGADRTDHLARHLQRAGRAGPRRKAWRGCATRPPSRASRRALAVPPCSAQREWDTQFNWAFTRSPPARKHEQVHRPVAGRRHRGSDHGREVRRQHQDRQAFGRRQELVVPDLRRHHRAGRDRRRQALRRDRHVHLRPGLHLDRQPASPRSPTSTATRASCSIAACRSSSWPSTATSWRPATCCCTANCRPRRRRPTSTTASRATPWCMSR